MEGYHTDNGRLLYHGRLVLPKTSPWIPRLFREFHQTAIGGHSGSLKTYQRMALELYWVGMRKDVANMVAECENCCICLSAYEDGTELHSLPCNHHFHAACIVKWLKMNATCPLCKYNILKGNDQV